MAEIDIQAKFDVSDVKKGTEEYIENINKVRQVTEFAAANIGASLKALEETTRRQMEEMKNAITAFSSSIGDQKNVIKGLEAEIKNLQAALNGASAGEMQKSIGSDLNIARKALEEEKAALVSLQNQQNASKNTLAELRQQYAQHTAQIKEATASNKLYASVLEVLPKPIQGAISATVNFTKASLALISTPLGAVLMALVAAYQAVSTWATYSKEGQDALAASSAFLSGIMNSLRETVLEAGEAIYMAFNDPKQAVINLWESIKNNLVKRIEGLGGVFKAFGKILSSGFTSGYADLADAFIQVNTGVEDFSQKAKDYIAKTEEMAVKTRKLQEEETKLNDAKRAASKKLVEYDQKIAEAKEKSTKQELSNSERKKATEEAKQLIQEKYDLEKKLGDEELRIQRARMELFKKTNQDYDKEAALEVKLLKLENDRENQLRALGSTSGAMSREIISAHEKISQELLSLQQQNQQAKIDLMAEGSAKELAQIQSDYQKKLAEIKKLADDWAAAQGGTLTAQQTVEISTAYTTAKQQKDEDTSKVYQKQAEELNKLLSQYQDYDAKRKEIEEKFASDMQALESQKTPANSAQIAAAQKELKYQREQALSEVANEFASRSEEFELWMNQIASYSLSRLYETLRAAQAELGKLQVAGIGGDQLAEAQAKVDAIEKEISKKRKGGSEAPGKRSVKEWQDLSKALSGVSDQFQEIGDNVGGTAGEIIKSAGVFTSSILKMIDNITTLSNTSISAIQGAGSAAEVAIKSVEAASVVLAIISATMQIAMQIANLFKGDDETAKYEVLKGQLEAINEIYGKIVDKSKEKIVFGGGFAAIEAAEEANEALKKQTDNYRRLAKEGGDLAPGNSHSYVHRANERLSGDFDNISKAIGENISRVQDMYKLTGDQLYIIQTKFPEAWSKIPAEITEPLNKIIECNDESKELAFSLNEALTGMTFDSFYDGFINSISDMDASFEDMCDDFEGYLRKSIIAGLVASKYKDRIKSLYDDWANYANNLKDLDDEKAAKAAAIAATNLQNGYKGIVESMIRDRDNLANAFHWETGGEQAKSQSGAISETITEQTASELTGLWRGSYDTLKGIYNVNTSFYENYKGTMSVCNGILSQISNNTGRTAENTTVLSGMNDTLNRMDGRLKTLETNSSKKYI